MVLTVAGSDSGGGAGVQGDIKTLSALGVFATSAIAALSAQNTLGVFRVQATSAEMLQAQIEAVIGDLAPASTKTGMLATAANVEVVAAFAAKGHLGPLVVDPVLASSSGQSLGGSEVASAIGERLLRHATVLTPNAAEAGAILGGDVATMQEMAEAAQALGALGASWVVLKGGDLAEERGEACATDVVWDGRRIRTLTASRVATSNTHGTGCAFSSAIAAGLAKGMQPWEAISAAKQYVSAALEGARRWRLGAGRGPLDHFGWGEAQAEDEPGGEQGPP